ncbi:uncharacterized protein BJX67DRAFT_298713 [Aspergillus lucknowensis]|uniref:Uncharacterized protein n=1 Tax=Aspergillus lucknowensis TaxID=176173 RepID=A0ABR4LDZ9_9EURO
MPFMEDSSPLVLTPSTEDSVMHEWEENSGVNANYSHSNREYSLIAELHWGMISSSLPSSVIAANYGRIESEIARAAARYEQGPPYEDGRSPGRDLIDLAAALERESNERLAGHGEVPVGPAESLRLTLERDVPGRDLRVNDQLRMMELLGLDPFASSGTHSALRRGGGEPST